MTTGIRELLAPLDRGFQLLTEKIEGQAFLRYLNKVAFVSKRPGNPYPHLVSVGRSPSNDVTLAVPTVSKVHGYFAFEGDGWGFTDHGSSNGSCLNRRRLKARETYTLGSGDVLRLGPEVNLRFMTPEALYRRARGGG
ncbi:MAG: FHA domain-containing protein [Acidobacteriota bacterium]